MKISVLNQSTEGGNGIPPTNHFIFENVETGEKFILGEIVVLQVYRNNKTKDLVFPGASFPRKTCCWGEASAKHVFQDYLEQAHNADGKGEMKIALTNLPDVDKLFQAIVRTFPSYTPEYV